MQAYDYIQSGISSKEKQKYFPSKTKPKKTKRNKGKKYETIFNNFCSVQSLSRIQHFVSPWTAACQDSLSITNLWTPHRLMYIESVMPSNHLTLYHPLLFLPSIFPSTRVFSNESALCIRWPKYWILASALVLPVNIQDWFPLAWTGWISLQSNGCSRVLSNTTIQKHQFFRSHLSL